MNTAYLIKLKKYFCDDVEISNDRKSKLHKTHIYVVNKSGLGKIRTCDTRFRKPVLYPLSYEAI